MASNRGKLMAQWRKLTKEQKRLDAQSWKNIKQLVKLETEIINIDRMEREKQG